MTDNKPEPSLLKIFGGIVLGGLIGFFLLWIFIGFKPTEEKQCQLVFYDREYSCQALGVAIQLEIPLYSDVKRQECFDVNGSLISNETVSRWIFEVQRMDTKGEFIERCLN